MTKRIVGLLFVVGMLAMTVAAFAGDHQFVATNKTGATIQHLYVSPSEKEEWGDDILGEASWAPDTQATITLKGADASDLWDLKIEDSEGTSITWTALNLGQVKAVTLHFQDGKAWAD